MNEHEQEAVKAIGAMTRTDLEKVAYLAWQYHRQTNQLCPVHDAGVDADPCICDWIDRTRYEARDALSELLP